MGDAPKLPTVETLLKQEYAEYCRQCRNFGVKFPATYAEWCERYATDYEWYRLEVERQAEGSQK